MASSSNTSNGGERGRTILKYEPPADHDSETRTVSVPLHDSISIGTLRDLADDAG